MYRIAAWSDLYGGDWVVVRVRDRRIMTTGHVWHCAQWVKVWGAVLADKGGQRLSDRATLYAPAATAKRPRQREPGAERHER